MKSSNLSYRTWFWVISILLVILKLLFAQRAELDLFTEEAQYWLWSKNLDWQYYSKPPMVAVLNFLGSSIFGDTEIGVRVIPALAGLASSWIVFLFAKRIFNSESIAFWSGMAFLAMPITLLEFTFHTTDTSLTFFWIWAWFLLYRAIQSGDRLHWIQLGIITALGLLSKTTMVLIYPASLIYLFFFGQFKSSVKNWLLFALISLLGFVPGLIWNFSHDFYTFKHLATLGGVGTSSSGTDWSRLPARVSEYLGGQIAMISVFLIPFLFRKPGVKRLAPVSWFLILPALMTFSAFFGLSFIKWVEINWPGFAFASIAIYLGVQLAKSTKGWKNYARLAIGLSLGLQGLLLLPNWLEWKSAGPLYQAEKAIFERMIGYEELGARVQVLADKYAGESSPVIFSESYHTSSELAFYMPNHPQTLVINMGSRKNQWDLWPGMDLQIGHKNRFVFVSRTKSSPSPVAQFATLLYEEKFPHYFGKTKMGETTIQVYEHLLDYQPVDSGAF